MFVGQILLTGPEDAYLCSKDSAGVHGRDSDRVCPRVGAGKSRGALKVEKSRVLLVRAKLRGGLSWQVGCPKDAIQAVGCEERLDFVLHPRTHLCVLLVGLRCFQWGQFGRP